MSLRNGLLVAAVLASGCSTPSPTRPSAPLASANVSVSTAAVQSGLSIPVDWRCVANGAGRDSYGIFSSIQIACPEAGGRALSAARVHAAAVAPASPLSLSSTVDGSTVVLSWAAAGGADPASSYVVEAGSSPGLADLANFDTGSTAPTLTALNVPAGTYYVRVRARNSAGVSGPSNEIVLVIGGGGGCNGAPGAPAALTATSSGSTVSLNWAGPSGGCAPQSYYIEAGSAPGRSDLADFSTGNPSTSFTAGGVGNGTYYVRVRSWTPAGKSAPSNEATLVVGASGGGCPAPAAPAVSYSVAGTSVTIYWATPAGSPSSYGIEVGRSPGAADVGSTTTASSSISFEPGSGTFYARVRSLNSCGTSGPSNEVTFAIGGPTPPGGTPPRAVFTILSSATKTPVVSCVVSAGTGPDSGYNVLRCDFDGSASTGNPTSYLWTSPALSLNFSGAIVREPRLGPCGKYPGEVTTDLTLTVASPAGSHSTTQEMTIAKGGNCG
jgi:hypothetical protein